MSEARIIAERQHKDKFYKSSERSPLTPDQQALFEGLSYYDYNPALDLTVTIEPFAVQDTFEVQTSTGDVRLYTRYGQFTFDYEGTPVTLVLYQTDHGFFLPFVDALSGQETYPAGRYIDPEDLGNHTFHIDFNRAYNPYCAYSPKWSCPITPPENRVKISLPAGEKLPHGDWVEKP
jgi:uncharacterized protein (DUF1684 family)